MIVSAHGYKEELKNKLIEKWYDDKYIYYFADERSELQMPNNCDWIHHMVHLNSKGEVDGAFIYNYNATSRSISGISLISFVDNGAPLMREFIKYMMDMFKKGARRAEFYAFTDNPACKQYDRIIAKYGGRKVGYLRETSYFDGRYHDMYIYEVHQTDIRDAASKRSAGSKPSKPWITGILPPIEIDLGLREKLKMLGIDLNIDSSNADTKADIDKLLSTDNEVCKARRELVRNKVLPRVKRNNDEEDNNG